MIKIIGYILLGALSLLSTFAVWACCKVAGEADRRFIEVKKGENK